MFDSETAKLLQAAPALSGLDPNDLPVLFTQHYAELSMARLRNKKESSVDTEEQWSLEKIADAYELIVSLDVNDAQTRRSSAFVAATANQILSRRNLADKESTQPLNIGITEQGVDPSISAALLFMLSEQYADAHEAAQSIKIYEENIYEARILTQHIRDLTTGNLNEVLKRGERWRREINKNVSLQTHALKAFFETLNCGVEILSAELLNKPRPQNILIETESAQAVFEKVLELTTLRTKMSLEFLSNTVLSSYPGPRHIAKLLLSVSKTLGNAALTGIPSPEGSDEQFWTDWLEYRANRYPFLWPNHANAVKQKFYYPGISAVLVLPTGAGKTTLSSLKIASTLAGGKKVLFLAPTHALVEQMTEDLQIMFPKEICNTLVTSDYDRLFLMESPLQEIEVMTPERCLAMLAFAPDAFAEVGLLVFDECHLLSPESHNIRRSLDGMLCILAFNSAVPDADMLFLSAMLKNGEQFSQWIESLTGRVTRFIDLLWKPSRQARGVIVYDNSEIEECKERALNIQRQKNKGREKRFSGLCKEANEQLQVHPKALWGLQHNWLGENTVRCSYTKVLSERVPLRGKLKRRGINLTPNANQVAAKIAASAALCGLKTIIFVNAKAHAVSTANDIIGKVSKEIVLTNTELDLWTVIEAELGGREYSFLSSEYVAVPHNSAMIRQERQLAESLFRRKGGADVIVATPTLAQGLNLPAQLAVLAGDMRANVQTGRREALASHEILNAAGRAGRAGHLANGLVLLIPDPILSFKTEKEVPADLIKKLDSILPDNDRCLSITDPLEVILDKISSNQWSNPDVAYTINRMSDWGDGSGKHLFNIQKSFAGFCAATKGKQQEFDRKVNLLSAEVEARQEFIFDHSLLALATQSGISAQMLTRLKMQIVESLDNPPTTVIDWIQWIFKWLELDDEARTYLLADVGRDIMTISGQDKEVGSVVTSVGLQVILPGVLGWVIGCPLATIEILILASAGKSTIDLGACENARKLTHSIIPRSLTFVAGVVSQLVNNCLFSDEQYSLDLKTVEALSTAIRQGYDSLEKLLFANANKNLSRVQIHQKWKEENHVPSVKPDA